MTVPGDEPTAEELERRYQVTAGDVRDLATHVYPNPIAADPQFGSDPATPTITDAMIVSWIERVSDSVRSRVLALAKYSEQPDRWAAVLGSARTATLNGAAAYMVDAAFPNRAGTNEQAGYSGALWSRYKDELDFLATDLPRIFVDQDAEGPIDEEGPVGTAPLITRQTSNIPGGLFYFGRYPDPYTYPPAPGAEYPRS